jgi:hypothetical protein
VIASGISYVFVATRMQDEHGFYAHFLNIQNSERVFQSEVHHKEMYQYYGRWLIDASSSFEALVCYVRCLRL